MKSNQTTKVQDGAAGKGTSYVGFSAADLGRNGDCDTQRPEEASKESGLQRYGRSKNHLSHLYNSTSNASYGNWFCRSSELTKVPAVADPSQCVANEDESFGSVGVSLVKSDASQRTDNCGFISNFIPHSGRGRTKVALSKNSFPACISASRLSKYQQFNTSHNKRYTVRYQHPTEDRCCRSPDKGFKRDGIHSSATECTKSSLQFLTNPDYTNFHSFQKQINHHRSKHPQSLLSNSLSNMEAENSIQKLSFSSPATLAQQKLQRQSAQATVRNGLSTNACLKSSDLIQPPLQFSTVETIRAPDQMKQGDHPQKRLHTHSQPGASKVTSESKCGLITNTPLIPRQKPLNVYVPKMMQQPRRTTANCGIRSPTICSDSNSERPGCQHFSKGTTLQNDTPGNRYTSSLSFFTTNPDCRRHLEGDFGSSSIHHRQQYSYSQDQHNSIADSQQNVANHLQETGDKPRHTVCVTAAPKRSILKNGSSKPQYCEKTYELMDFPFSASIKSGRRQSMSDLSFYRRQKQDGCPTHASGPPNATSESTGCASDVYSAPCQQTQPRSEHPLQGRNASEQKSSSKTLGRKKVSFML